MTEQGTRGRRDVGYGERGQERVLGSSLLILAPLRPCVSLALSFCRLHVSGGRYNNPRSPSGRFGMPDLDVRVKRRLRGPGPLRPVAQGREEVECSIIVPLFFGIWVGVHSHEGYI